MKLNRNNTIEAGRPPATNLSTVREPEIPNKCSCHKLNLQQIWTWGWDFLQLLADSINSQHPMPLSFNLSNTHTLPHNIFICSHPSRAHSYFMPWRVHTIFGFSNWQTIGRSNNNHLILVNSESILGSESDGVLVVLVKKRIRVITAMRIKRTALKPYGK